MPQLQAYHPFALRNLGEAGERMALGYVLKAGIADPVGRIVDGTFSSVAAANTATLWGGMLLYSLQILADFAGYSLIAIGVARLFGYQVLRNFEQPYLSASFSEFWRRWHISLSAWLQEYLFMPLFQALLRRLDNRQVGRESARMPLAYAAACLGTMTLAGIWHGAGLTFLAWGLLHGVALSIERVLVFGAKPIPKGQRFGDPARTAKSLFAMAVVFLLVSLFWVPFRADSLRTALLYYAGMVRMSAGGMPSGMVRALLLGYGALALIEVAQYSRRDEWALRAAPVWLRPAVYGALLAHTMLYASRSGNTAFVYAQF